MRTPRRAQEPAAAARSRKLVFTAVAVCVALHPALASGQRVDQADAVTAVTQVATVSTGTISGVVLDERGLPLDGVVVSALGGSTAVTVTDRAGQFSLKALTPGPYLVRAHLPGYLAGRSSIVTVRPSARTVSSLTLRREGPVDEPRVLAAGVGVADAESSSEGGSIRDDSETAWRLRHLRRSVLKDTATLLAAADDEGWFLTDSFGVVGRAVESSARLAGAFITEPHWQGQVNLLTTGAFDTPVQLLDLDRTHSVAYFVLGAPVGEHGDWTVRAALNQGDLSSWILAGSYETRQSAAHRYQFGMTYGMQRYEGGNAAALAAVAESDRNAGAVFGQHEWTVSPHVTLGYGANYAVYDYMPQRGHFSPHLSATIVASDRTRARARAARQVTAPGAQEFLPPTHAHVLPPHRTFAPLSRDGFRTEDLQHYEVGLDHQVGGAVVGVRGFHQRVDDQMVTIFGLRSPDAPASDLGHFFVASAGDVSLNGWGVSVARSLGDYVRGSVDYAVASATWSVPPAADHARLAQRVPSAIRPDQERIHNLTTSLDTTVPQTATRVFFLVKLNNGFIRGDGTDQRPGIDGRFDLQITQALAFMNFLRAEWEMLVAVKNLYRESLTEMSFYDELLVARPPKRLIGGLTVKF